MSRPRTKVELRHACDRRRVSPLPVRGSGRPLDLCSERTDIAHNTKEGHMESSKARTRRSKSVAADSDVKRVRLREAARDDAEHAGLLSGERTEHLSVRTTRALVAEAKRRTGISSNTELVEMALAALATPDPVSAFMTETY